jgi:hypothetical protein
MRQIRVQVLNGGGNIFATEGSCACAQNLEPVIGACVETDAAVPCECLDADPCVETATIEPMSGVRFDGHTMRGSVLGRTLTITDCDATPITITLPDAVPSQVMVTETKNTGSDREVVFTADETIATVWGTSGATTTQTCRVDATAGSILFPMQAGQAVTLRAESEAMVLDETAGRVTVRAVNGAAF